MPDLTGWSGIFSAMGLTFIAFEGYEIIVQAGEEVIDPRRTIPKAIFLSLAIVVPIYMLVAFVLVGASSPAFLLHTLQELHMAAPAAAGQATSWQILGSLGELGLAHAAAEFVPFGAYLILVGAMLSTMSALNATTFSSSRVAFAMGRDDNLPDMFAHVSPKRRTPSVAVGWTAVLIAAMVALVPLTTVAAASDIMFLLLFLQVNFAVITIRKKYGHKRAYGYMMPFFPLVPIVEIVTKLGLALFMFNRYPAAWGYVLLWLVAGVAIYWTYARGREQRKEAPPVLAEEKAVVLTPHSVLVPVAGLEAGRRHVRIAADIARCRGSAILLLHAVRVPRQLPASAASPFVAEARPLLDALSRYAESLGVPAATMVRVCHEPADAIVHTSLDSDIDYLVMGWKGVVHGRNSVIGHNLDRVLATSATHAIVVQSCPERPGPERVLVPLSNPLGARIGLSVAALVNSAHPDTAATIVHATRAELDEARKAAFRDAVQAALEGEGGEDWQALPRCPVRFIFLVAEDPIGAIAVLSGQFDRMVVGTSEAGLWRAQVFGTTPLRIVQEARCPAILVRRRQAEIKTEVQRFFEFFRGLDPTEEVPRGGAAQLVIGGEGDGS